MYAKLFTSIYQGTLRGDSHGLLVFTNLIAHADSAGHVDIHPRAIADEVGLTLEQVKEALLKLEAPDSESRSPELDGRRIVRLNDHRDWGWVVVNYLKYRAIRDEEDRREQNRLAQQRWRERQKGVLTVGEVSSVSQDKPIQRQKKKQKENSVEAIASTGDKSPDDPADVIFGYGVPMLVDAGLPEKQARSFLGRLRKTAGDDAVVIDALRKCYKEKPMQPVEFLGALISPKSSVPDHLNPRLNKQLAVEQRNRAVGDAWLAKMEANDGQP